VFAAGFPHAEAWKSARLDVGRVSGAADWSSEGTRFRVAVGSLSGPGARLSWKVVTVRTAAALEAPIAAITGRVGWAFLIASIVLTIVLVIVATRFVAPVRRLTAATTNTERAGAFKPLEVRSQDEVGALTRSFNQMMSTIQDYESDLEAKVRERTRALAEARQELKDIFDNMEQGIFTVDPTGRINNEYSAYCERLFGDVGIAGKQVLELLQLQTSDPETYSRTAFWLGNICGADQLQWELGRPEPAASLVYARPGASAEKRVIDLEYAPIYKEGVVTKVMVIAKDVTELRGLAAEVQRKDEENRRNLARVAEIVSLEPELFFTFLAECHGVMQRCDDACKALAAEPANLASIADMFRAVHTLKGNARIFKLSTIQNAAHDLEDDLQRLRDAQRAVTAGELSDFGVRLEEVRKLLLEFEALGRRVLGRGGDEAAERQDFIHAADAALQGCKESLSAWSAANDDRQALNTLFGRVHTLKGQARAANVKAVHERAEAVEDVLHALREGRDAIAPETVQKVASLLSDIESSVNSMRSGQPRSAGGIKIQESRVLAVRQRFKELTRYVEEKTQPSSELQQRQRELADAVASLTRVPAQDMLERFRKMAFDLAGELGKRVDDLVIEGGELEVDTKLLDLMRDVLMHALRNSVDHGLETPEERTARNKPEKGRLSLRCRMDEGGLVFEVNDDGRGVDYERVKKVAFERRLISEQQLDRVSEGDLCELLFQPGFSTAKSVTAVSGRGVGMDFIRSTMRQLKGEAVMRSQTGMGSVLTLTIPADHYQRI
jgi:two-component system, chemotaxis family, sensor kinase CheA